jgi:alcohol dehydrogenase
VCTSVGGYLTKETPIPLFQMYATGVTFHTGRVNARVEIPEILSLVESGRLKPERITTKLASWKDASEALFDRSAKVVIVRDY